MSVDSPASGSNPKLPLIRVKEVLKRVYTPDGHVNGDDFRALIECFKRDDGSSYFAETAASLGIDESNLTRHSAQAVFTVMAANCKSTDLSAFHLFNYLVAPHPETIAQLDVNIKEIEDGFLSELKEEIKSHEKEKKKCMSDLKKVKAKSTDGMKAKKKSAHETRIQTLEAEIAQHLGALYRLNGELRKAQRQVNERIDPLQKQKEFLQMNIFESYGRLAQLRFLKSETPFLSSISMHSSADGLFRTNRMLDSIPEAHKAAFREQRARFNNRNWGIETFIGQIQGGTSIAKPTGMGGAYEAADVGENLQETLKDCLAQDFAIYNLADTDIPEGTVIQAVNRDGEIKAFQAHQIMDIKGLRCMAYTSMATDGAPEIKVVFLGTTDFASGTLDAQRHSPGYRSMMKREGHILDELNKLAQELYEQTGQNVKIDILGHSLGGALAQHLHAAVSTNCARAQVGDEALRDVSQDGTLFTTAEKRVEARTTIQSALDKYNTIPRDGGFAHVGDVSLTTKCGAKGSKRDDILSTASMHALGGRVTGSNLVMRVKEDWVHGAGERVSMAQSPDIRTRVVKVETGYDSWGDRHNFTLVNFGNSDRSPLQIQLDLDSSRPEDRNAIVRETTKSNRVLNVGRGVAAFERSVSAARGVRQKGQYSPTQSPSTSPVLFRQDVYSDSSSGSELAYDSDLSDLSPGYSSGSSPDSSPGSSLGYASGSSPSTPLFRRSKQVAASSSAPSSPESASSHVLDSPTGLIDMDDDLVHSEASVSDEHDVSYDDEEAERMAQMYADGPEKGKRKSRIDASDDSIKKEEEKSTSSRRPGKRGGG